MKKLLLALSIILLTACNQRSADTAATDSEAYTVVGVKDGDTIELLKDGQTEVVRLAEIDCPEKAQAFGKRAKQFTADLCFGKQVKLQAQKKRDQYGRIVAIVFIDDTLCLNKELLRAGYAWHFKRYSQNEEYAQLEDNARNAHTGLWADADPIAPWQWRKGHQR